MCIGRSLAVFLPLVFALSPKVNSDKYVLVRSMTAIATAKGPAQVSKYLAITTPALLASRAYDSAIYGIISVII